ncbi:MAG TPA: class I fructose-bisphosphate aldolase [Candidatus Limnocylindrales bacterium]|nr:class I fructose-bisphosphate aldolase [Candidatus Limnocylindrales bacterium]
MTHPAASGDSEHLTSSPAPSDELAGLLGSRCFKAIGVGSTEAKRRDYRELMFRAPDADKYISGVILYDETIKQKAADGTPLVKVLAGRGIIPGIKVDKGAVALPGSPREKFTLGFDGLRERLAEYRTLGARFAKWRAVIEIDDVLPSEGCINENAHSLALYAALCQEADIVPIVEPEVLMDGAHGLERCFAVTERVHHAVFDQLGRYGVALEGMLLKPNMAIPGAKASKQASAAEIAQQTVRLFKRTVPAAVPGIVFLSGGQSDEVATANLNEMNKLGPLPWRLSFSYGRALQHAVQITWKGNAGQVGAAQQAFQHRARLNGAATLGKYTPAMEKELVTA